MPLTDAQKAEYLKSSGSCPFCQECDIEGDSLDVDGDTTTQMVSCNNCGAAWVDTYTLTDITVTEEPEGE